MPASSLQRPVGLVALIAIVLTGAGCVSETGMIAPTAPTVTPAGPAVSVWPEDVTESDPDHIYDAALQAVRSYVAVTDLITSDGGQGPSRMASLTTPDWFFEEERAFARYRSEGLKTLGTTRVDSLVVQSLWSPVAGGVALDVVACVDARWVWLVGQDTPEPPDGLADWLMAGVERAEVDDDVFEQWTEYIDTYDPRPGTRDPVVVWLVGPHIDELVIDGTTNWEGAHTCHLGNIE